jgi:hypothetical protein
VFCYRERIRSLVVVHRVSVVWKFFRDCYRIRQVSRGDSRLKLLGWFTSIKTCSAPEFRVCAYRGCVVADQSIIVNFEKSFRSLKHQFKSESRRLFESVSEYRRAIVVSSCIIVGFVLVEKSSISSYQNQEINSYCPESQQPLNGFV